MTSGAFDDFYDEIPPVLGLVLTEDRGSLPFALVHGEALVAAAAWSLGESGVTLVDLTVPWESLAEAGSPLVLHDSLCPMTPPEFIAACVETARADDVVVVGVRPVTDTVKEARDDDAGPAVGATVPRDELWQVCSPVVLPPRVVAAWDGLPSLQLTDLVDRLRRELGDDVVLREAPAAARRVTSADDLPVLEALTAESAGTPLPDQY